MVCRMTAIESPAPDSSEGAANLISGAVQTDDAGNVVVVPVDGVEDPFVSRDVSPQASNERQAELVGEQPEVSVPGVAAQF